MKKTLRKIENSTCWDWAYVCATFGGKCEKCEVCKNGKCAFAQYNKEKDMGEVLFTTHPYFLDVEQDILLQHMKRIIKEKGNEHAN